MIDAVFALPATSRSLPRTGSSRPPAFPAGRLRLLFQYVRISGRTTVQIHANISGGMTRILRRAAPLEIVVTIELKANGRIISKMTGDSTLRAR